MKMCELANLAEPFSGARGVMVVLSAVLTATGAAHAQELQVDREAERLVRFVSQASLEDFEGVTDAIDGFVLLPGDLAPGADLSGSRIYLEVDLASLDTGISLRNRHMRDNYLHTNRFPYATFSARIVKISQRAPGILAVVATGTLAIHGVERERTLECETGDGLPPHRVRCEFEVGLTDHSIKVPRLMFMKVADTVQVLLEFTLTEP